MRDTREVRTISKRTFREVSADLGSWAGIFRFGQCLVVSHLALLGIYLDLSSTTLCQQTRHLSQRLSRQTCSGQYIYYLYIHEPRDCSAFPPYRYRTKAATCRRSFVSPLTIFSGPSHHPDSRSQRFYSACAMNPRQGTEVTHASVVPHRTMLHAAHAGSCAYRGGVSRLCCLLLRE
jgi:hypothetical protein